MSRNMAVPLIDETAPLWKVSLLGWLFATLPAIGFVAIAQAVLPAEMFDAVDDAVWDEALPMWANVAGIVVFAPVVETLMMAAGFAVLSLFRVPPPWQIGFQTAAWAILHGAVAPGWAIGPAWIFFVLSVVWVNQRRAGWSKAFLAVTFIHVLNNALATVGLLAERAQG